MNKFTFKKLKNEDIEKIIEYTIKGMNFDKYFKTHKDTQDYGRFYVYREMEHSSDYLALYNDDRFLGVLFYNVLKDSKLQLNNRQRQFFDNYYKKALKEYPNDFLTYPNAIDEMKIKNNLSSYDLEMTLFVVDQTRTHEGIGSFIYDKFACMFKDKKVYVFTDENCSYGFYENKGFTKIDEKYLVYYNDEESSENVLLYKKTL